MKVTIQLGYKEVIEDWDALWGAIRDALPEKDVKTIQIVHLVPPSEQKSTS
jgi:hypothetical protein